MAVTTKRLGAASLFTLLTAWAGAACAEMRLNFPEPAAGVAQEIYDIHMLTTTIATVLLVIIFSVVGYSLYYHRKSRGYQADQKFHETWFGRWSWVVVPVLVLGVDLTIASSAQKTLEKVWEVPKEEDLLDVKVIGHQWWWEYEYLDHSVEIDGQPKPVKVESRYVPEDQSGDRYLREVDNPLVLPVGRKVRFLHTSADVLHAFWVPELAVKKDAIPGYVTETWVDLNREGRFSGQCAELCGTWHSRMPIEVDVVSPEKFATWMEDQKQVMLACRRRGLAGQGLVDGGADGEGAGQLQHQVRVLPSDHGQGPAAGVPGAGGQRHRGRPDPAAPGHRAERQAGHGDGGLEHAERLGAGVDHHLRAQCLGQRYG